MFSFKKKDKDRTETKEGKRERRKREKDLKEKQKHEKKADHLSDIVAGFESEDKKTGRFSFRRSDKRKYDMEHGYEDTEGAPSLVKMEHSNEMVRSDSSEGASSNGPSPYQSTGSVNSAPTVESRQQYPGARGNEEDSRGGYPHNGNGYAGSNRPDDRSRPVPAPRRKKSSSIEIKLRKGMNDAQSSRAGEEWLEYENDAMVEAPSSSYQERRISASSKQTDIGDRVAPNMKPHRVQADRESGVVEVKLINAGSKREPQPSVEIERPIVLSSIVTENLAAPPAEDMVDSKPNLMMPPKGANIPINVISPTEKTFDDVDLKLPEMAPATPGIARVIRMKRRPSGDFGFALRRSTSPGGRTVHFVEPVGPGADTGLLPGDRLIEVNGTNIENEDREKIIQMIAMSGNEVVIKVIPVPELSELSVRSGLDGSTVQLDESNLRAGTLARSGSKRMKKKVKSEEEVSSQKAWLDAEKVWVVHKAGFSGGRVQKIRRTDNEDEPPLCKVKLDHGGEIITVEEDSIEKANPPQYDRAEDLASLRYLNESSCLHTLRQRYGSSLIHTYAGSNLVIFNPQQQLSIYTEKVIQMFRGCKQEDMPPHIFATAQTAYRNMLATRADQSLVLLGNSGAGKTVNCRHILHYLTAAAAAQHSALTEQKLEAIFALLEAFGNVSTVMNNSASRFTMLFSMDFDSAGLLTCSAIQTFLLEKSRVVRQPEGESTFKIFHYFIAGCDSKLRKELHLDTAVMEPNDFMMAFDPKSTEDNQRFSDKWTEIEFALQVLGISQEEAKGIWSVLATIYHLGSAGVIIGADNKPHFSNPAAAQRAAQVVGTTPEDLAEIVFAPPPVNQFMVKMRHSPTGSPASSAEASPEKQAKSATAGFVEALEGLAMGFYQEAFSAVIRFINRSLQCSVRSVSSMHVLDSPGFQNAASLGRTAGASFEELCHNYECERLQKFFHHTVFTAQMERYSQENIECSFESVATSPDPVVSVFDKAAQGGMRGSSLDLKNDQKGLLWILDEESIFPGANDSSFLARLYVHHYSDRDSWVKQGGQKDTFVINHCQGTLPVTYNARGWLKLAREHAATKQAHPLLVESSKSAVSDLFSSHRSASEGLVRTRSFRRAQVNPTIKKNSVCLQLIYQVDTILDAIRKTKVNFVRCILPVDTAGHFSADTLLPSNTGSKEAARMDVPLVRQQLRAAEMLDAVRIHRQGYPEHMPFAEFRRRFDILAPYEHRNSGPVLDEKKAVGTLLEHLETDKRSFRLGLSQIFFRAGTLAQLEDARDEKTTDTIVELQAYCRGFLGRKKFKKLQLQHTAMRCIQKNVRKFLIVKNWSWWRLYTKVLPLLDVHRTEEELKAKADELDVLKAKIAKLEKENKDYAETNGKLEQKVAELSASLSEERAASSHASELLEGETMGRMSAERQLQELQEALDTAKKKKEKLEVELLQAQELSMAAPRGGERYEGEGASDEEEDSFYRERYIQASRQHEQLRKKLQNQAELDVELVANQKRQLERKLTEEKAEREELQRQLGNLKKKAARLHAEMEDMKLLLEEEQSRNADLEKKQRRFDAEMNSVKEEVNHERTLKDKISREKEKFMAEKYKLEHEHAEAQEELEKLRKEKAKMETDFDDLTKHGPQSGDVVTLKKTIRALEEKTSEQEEELDDQAGKIQMLEQAKLRLEMSAERDRQSVQKELEAKEEELEETKYNLQRKIKQMEDQLEDEYSEKTAAVKAKRDFERRLEEMRDNFERGGIETERKLRRELKRTKALLKDAQAVIETQSQKLPKERNQMKALKNKLEDTEFSLQTAVKARKKLEDEMNDLQLQVDSLSKGKKEVESKYMTALKQNNELSSKTEEDEEELERLTEKNRQLLKELSTTQGILRETEVKVQDLISEKESLEAQHQQVSNRLSYLEESTVEKQAFAHMERTRKELEAKLDLEDSFKRRQEAQVTRLKEQVNRLTEEKDELQSREAKVLLENSRLERQMRELREELSVVERQQGDHRRRKTDAEEEVENLEALVASLKQELNLSKQRVKELQNALEDDMHYNSDGMSNDDDDDDDMDMSDSDSDFANEIGRRASKPRSYQSYDSLDDGDDLGEGLRRKLSDLVDEDDSVFKGSARSPRGAEGRGEDSRKLTRGTSGADGESGSAHKRRRSSEHKKRRGSEKRRGSLKKEGTGEE